MMDRRTVLAGVIACPLIASRSAAQAPSNIIIGFAPPLGMDLYSVTKTTVATARAGLVSLSVTRRYRFSRNGRGYALTSVLESMSDDAPPDLSRNLRANLAPLQGMALGFVVSEQGALVALSDDFLGMSAVERSVTTTLTDAPPSPLLQSIAAMTPEQQRGLLFNEVRDLTRFAGQRVRGAVLDGDMVMIQAARTGEHDLPLSARVHVDSGISWLVERTADAAQRPRRGVVASRMELLP